MAHLKYRILYLDSQKRKAVRRALAKYGEVCLAPDINEALVAMCEQDFDYFFVDADTPYSRPFIIHLRHDPQLLPPKAVVLLTDNEEEDSEAWAVDTYLHRERVEKDLPYVFSHLKGEGTAPENVLSISAPREEARSRNMAREATPENFEEETAPIFFDEQIFEVSSSAEQVKHKPPLEEEEPSDVEKPKSAFRLGEEPRPLKREVHHPQSAKLKILGLALALVAFIVCAFTIGPFEIAKQSAGSKEGTSHKVEAESSNPKRSFYVPEVSEGESPAADFTLPSLPTNSPTLPENPAKVYEQEPKSESISSASSKGSEIPSTQVESPERSQPSKAANAPPSVRVSGPALLHVRETGTYVACASDADGDPLSYSWGSSTKQMSWATPGLYSLSVVVTDCKGMSGSASMSVRVIQ